jgi:hypothetical protein
VRLFRFSVSPVGVVGLGQISLATAALLHSTSPRLAHVATSIAAVHRSCGEAGVFVAAAHRTPKIAMKMQKRRRGSLPGSPVWSLI